MKISLFGPKVSSARSASQARGSAEIQRAVIETLTEDSSACELSAYSTLYVQNLTGDCVWNGSVQGGTGPHVLDDDDPDKDEFQVNLPCYIFANTRYYYPHLYCVLNIYLFSTNMFYKYLFSTVLIVGYAVPNTQH